MSKALASVCMICYTVGTTVAGEFRTRRLTPPVVEGRWVRPSSETPAQPVWGHAQGLRVGLAPLPGPRGLLRIYAPQVGLPEGRMINFIAVEPTVAVGSPRGYSELERSDLDRRQGKRFWSADNADDATPRSPTRPARGTLLCTNDLETLSVFVFVEPFKNGTKPYLRLTFRSDRPEEVGIATFAQPGSKPMHQCILTATMGNYARLRRLHLEDAVVSSTELWPAYRGDGFARPRLFPLSRLWRGAGGEVIVAATPNEANPGAVDYPSNVPGHWRYRGAVATQYWRAETPHRGLAALVNGRFTYWRSQVPIPGGIAYENFELMARYREGQAFWFGVTRKTPKQLGITPSSSGFDSDK